MTSAELLVDGVVDTTEAKRFLSVGTTRLYDILNSGDLISLKVGKKRMIPKRALVAFLEARLNEAAGE